MECADQMPDAGRTRLSYAGVGALAALAAHLLRAGAQGLYDVALLARWETTLAVLASLLPYAVCAFLIGLITAASVARFAAVYLVASAVCCGAALVELQASAIQHGVAVGPQYYAQFAGESLAVFLVSCALYALGARVLKMPVKQRAKRLLASPRQSRRYTL